MAPAFLILSEGGVTAGRSGVHGSWDGMKRSLPDPEYRWVPMHLLERLKAHGVEEKLSTVARAVVNGTGK